MLSADPSHIFAVPRKLSMIQGLAIKAMVISFKSLIYLPEMKLENMWM
jgi:hypothetical protein